MSIKLLPDRLAELITGKGYDTLHDNNQKDLIVMSALRAIVHIIDSFTERCGQVLAWLVLAMAGVTTLIVIMRYGFNTGSIMAQEAVIYMHGCLFMLAAAYTLKQDEHVRVDIFYRNFSPRRAAWINSLGAIVFVIPLCFFIFISSWDYVSESWTILETSPEPGGIPAVFLLKTLLPAMAVSLFLQALAEALRNLLTLMEPED